MAGPARQAAAAAGGTDRLTGTGNRIGDGFDPVTA
jgi:hypothetical protein